MPSLITIPTLRQYIVDHYVGPQQGVRGNRRLFSVENQGMTTLEFIAHLRHTFPETSEYSVSTLQSAVNRTLNMLGYSLLKRHRRRARVIDRSPKPLKPEVRTIPPAPQVVPWTVRLKPGQQVTISLFAQVAHSVTIIAEAL